MPVTKAEECDLTEVLGVITRCTQALRVKQKKRLRPSTRWIQPQPGCGRITIAPVSVCLRSVCRLPHPR